MERWIEWPGSVRDVPDTGHQVIEASAGTGKTYTLEHLLLRELVRGVAIERMVVVTFTEKATEELRTRVRSQIERTLAGRSGPMPEGAVRVEGALARRLELALSRFDRAPIATFHAFCQRLLSEHAFSGGRFLRETLVSSERLRSEAFRRALTTCYAVEQREQLAKYLDSHDLNALEATLARIHRTPDELVTPGRDHPEAGLILGFLPAYRRALAEVKARLGAYDFDDLIDGVRDAVCDPEHGPALVKALRERYEVALIDEFQDTDPVQWAIFDRVFREAPQRMIMIGDPKQAIYGFRGADVGTYHQATREILGDRPPHRLDVCHRASAALIEAYNAFLERGVLPDGAYPAPVRPSERAPRLTDPSRDGGMVLVEVDGMTAAAQRHNLGAWIAGEIQRLSREARLDGKRIGYADVFVLTYSAAEAYAVGDSLREVGIPIAFYKPDGLFQSAEAAAWRDVLAAVRAPLDAAAVKKALLTPFFEVPLERVGDVDGSGRSIGAARVARWARIASARHYGALFSRILDDSGVSARAAFDAGREREITNLLHLAEILLEESARTRPTLDALITWLDRAIGGTDGPRGHHKNEQRLEGEASAVQIMTVHKSKGLEAAVVFLYGGFHGMSFRPGPHAYRVGDARWIDLRQDTNIKKEKDEAIHAAVMREEQEELGRLGYVALTRAKARVYVPFIGGPSKFPGRHQRLQARAKELVAAGHPKVTAPAAPWVHGAGPGAPPPPRWQPDPELLTLPPPPNGFDFAEVARTRAGHQVTSYTRMKQLADLSAERDALLEEELVLGEPHLPPPLELAPGELPPGPDVGVFLHQILERVPLDAIGPRDAWVLRPDVAEIFDAAMIEHRIDPGFRGEAERLVHAGLTVPLALGDHVLEGVARADQVVREMEFLFPWPGEYVKGYLDVVLEAGGKTWIVDWKSDRLASYAPDAIAEQVRARYAIQVQLYALALERILRPDRTHQLGGIVYVFLRGLDGGQGVHVEIPTARDLDEWNIALSKQERRDRPKQRAFPFVPDDYEPAVARKRGRR